MAHWKLWSINVLAALAGLAVALWWIFLAGGLAGLPSIERIQPLSVVVMLVLTAGCLGIRFIRWQFLTRHCGIRLTVRPSLTIYLASLVGTATPAYVGEAVRAVWIRDRFGVPAQTTLSVLIFERLLDALALSILACLAAPTWWMRATMLLVAVGVLVAGAMAAVVLSASGQAGATVLAAVRRPDIIFNSLLLSLAAWFLAALQMSVAAWSLDLAMSPFAGVHVFASSLLFGALTLMPAGVGVTGSFAITELLGMGYSTADSVSVVFIVRLATTGVSLAIGVVCALLLLRREKVSTGDDAAAHFDDIAIQYGDQFKPHVWNHLLARKVGMIADALPPTIAAGRGLDLGCGLGEQCLALAKRGFRVFGMDVSQRLVEAAGRSGAIVTAGSALNLPFRDASLDFVYAVGVLHHLPTRDAQREAYLEVCRVLKPNGRFIVHETNTRNPLFRFYMGYLFPLLKKIDEGTEWWIEPWQFHTISGLRPVHVRFFTFMPDFVPSWLMKPCLAIDRRLERSRFGSYSVHYIAVLERDASWQGASNPDAARQIAARAYANLSTADAAR